MRARLPGHYRAQAISILWLFEPVFTGLQYRRVLSACCAIGIQICFIMAFGTFRQEQAPDGAGDLRLVVLQDYRAVEPDPSLPPEIELQHPDASTLLPPRIEIIEVGQGKQTSTGSMPARPDPNYPNTQPTYSEHGERSGVPTPAVVVVARILVLADGTIGEAVLAGSCGRSDLDAAALSYVKSHWRFLPATRDGAPIKDWITVEVYIRGD